MYKDVGKYEEDTNAVNSKYLVLECSFVEHGAHLYCYLVFPLYILII
jgi:hypothetical protein